MRDIISISTATQGLAHTVEQHDHVTIRDRHYFPTYGRTRPYVHNDSGQHQGWYKHEHDH